MLVLSRKKNEAIIIGGFDGLPLVKLVVVEIRGDKARLGIEAATEVPVHRLEVYEAIQRDLLKETDTVTPVADPAKASEEPNTWP